MSYKPLRGEFIPMKRPARDSKVFYDVRVRVTLSDHEMHRLLLYAASVPEESAALVFRRLALRRLVDNPEPLEPVAESRWIGRPNRVNINLCGLQLDALERHLSATGACSHAAALRALCMDAITRHVDATELPHRMGGIDHERLLRS